MIRLSLLPLLLTLFICPKLWGQPQTGRFINTSIGLGITAYDEDVDFSGTGFYVQGEYGVFTKKWLGLRPIQD